MNVLLVDDERIALTSVRRILNRRGIMRVDLCDNGKEAIERIKKTDYDIALIDLLMPDMDGLQVLEAAKPFRPSTEFIVITAIDDVATAVKAIRLGAYDYLVKPVDDEKLMLAIERAHERKGLLAGLAGAGSKNNCKEVPTPFSGILTRDSRMRELLSYAEIMARSGNPVLITGESGTGKELLAQGIHRASQFKDGPFVAVNVPSLPETLFESHFFGHSKGAFTGADRDHSGFFF